MMWGSAKQSTLVVQIPLSAMSHTWAHSRMHAESVLSGILSHGWQRAQQRRTGGTEDRMREGRRVR